MGINGVQTRSRKNSSAKETPTAKALQSAHESHHYHNGKDVYSASEKYGHFENDSEHKNGLKKVIRRSKRKTLKKSMETIRKGQKVLMSRNPPRKKSEILKAAKEAFIEKIK